MERTGLNFDVPGMRVADPADVAKEGLDNSRTVRCSSPAPTREMWHGATIRTGPEWSSALTG